MWGLPPDAHVDEEVFLAGIHPEDRPRVEAAIAASVDPAGPGLYAVEYRVIGIGDGIERWVSTRGRTTFKNGQPVGFSGAVHDVTTRKLAEQALHEIQERQAFLLSLSDALRAERNPDAVADRAVRAVAERLRLDRCYLASYRLEDDRADITHQAGTERLAPMPATIHLSDFPEAFQVVFDHTLVIDDVLTDDRLSPVDTDHISNLGMRALVAPTLRRGAQRPLWVIVAASVAARHWTAGEITLLEDAAERTWVAIERARAEQALHESEARFQQFANASAGALWIRDAATLGMEYVSQAALAIYGVGPEDLLGDLKVWAAMILPEDRDAALAHIERVRAGDTEVHEFRIQRPDDKAFRWVRNVGFPLRDAQGRVERVGGIFQDVTEEKLAVEHQGVLLAELQHRVRNIMAIIRAIAARTGERAESVADYAERIGGRLMALARVQALITRKADGGVGLKTLILDEVSVQAHHEGQYDLAGPDVLLSPKAAEVLTLAIHELATNALKYGALSVEAGKVTVRWDVALRHGRPWLVFDWREEGGPPVAATAGQPRQRGFGSELIEGRIPYELGGSGRVVIASGGGAQCHLEFPLQDGASALETGSPQRSTVYGGALDMTGEARLDGSVVLVVEDEYYIATDTARALQSAGAEVVGPFRTEKAARSAMEEQRPDAVVVDINLGAGPSFKFAETLKDEGIPFVFVTGYDQQVIPEEFNDVERLEKPVQLRRVVSAVAELLHPTT